MRYGPDAPGPLLGRWSLAAAAVTLVAVALAYVWSGGGIFSPGGLHGGTGDSARLGGVASHAQLSENCAACHPAPWSGETVSGRCLECHSDVRAALGDSTRLHGQLADPRDCVACHTEHRGRDGILTRTGPEGFDHGATGFPLTGAHARTECRACHGEVGTAGGYGDAGTQCVDCHAEKDVHEGGMGASCGTCHGTDDWSRVEFEHRFPLSHGRREPAECAVCHRGAPNSYDSYTCYGCHEHSERAVRFEHREEGIADVADCIECHPTGREEEHEYE